MRYGGDPKNEALRLLSERRRARRAQGLCAAFGCEVVTGDESYMCAEHAPGVAKRVRAFRARKRLAREIERGRAAGG